MHKKKVSRETLCKKQAGSYKFYTEFSLETHNIASCIPFKPTFILINCSMGYRNSIYDSGRPFKSLMRKLPFVLFAHCYYAIPHPALTSALFLNLL